EEQQADLVQELIDSHCGMIPESLAVSMSEAQRLRDASFAEASIRALDKGGKPVVLITGSGHARLDRGVPLYLKTAEPELSIVSVGLTEPGEASEGLYNFTIETEAVERDDPCAAFAAAMTN
ncbi:MAG: ChaN family lipoprotein, partial [Pseudomonadota bacterium]